MLHLKLLLTILALGLYTTAHAKLVQIIHTNDLHSVFAGSRDGYGGYARIKTLVDQLKADAAAKGIKTLFLDAGDFGEGSSYYFSSKGVDSFRALDLLGVDVTVLGNHDYMLGANELAGQIEQSKLQAKLISANLKGKKLLKVKRLIPDSVDFDIDGMKIRVFGLSTSELHYQYPILPLGFIGGSHKAGLKMAQQAQNDNVDFLIALTHTGVKKDQALAANTMSINAIIGGHSHTRLDQPLMIENLKGELVPIVQTGAHGVAVGSMLVDIQGGGDAKMVDYRLYDVTSALDENSDVKAFVDQAYVNREKYFNRPWDEVIGFSEITLTGQYHGVVRDSRSCWSQHIARLTRETAKAQLGVQFDLFQGDEIPAGEIRFGDLVDNFPHVRQWGDAGWSISKARVSGLIIKILVKNLRANSLEATFDGLQNIDPLTGEITKFKIGVDSSKNAGIGGKKINVLRYYSVAMPSEIPHALKKTLKPVKDLLLVHAKKMKNSNYWPVLESYIKAHSPLKCLAD